MTNWLQGIFGENLSPAMTFIILFAAIILGVLLLIWIARRLMGGTFVAGGRGRHLRLAVMDATPVDSRRRLVLVRRDDVEHLILIGGPTDLVVEQNIRLAGAPASRPMEEAQPPVPAHAPAPALAPVPTPPPPLRRPEPPRPEMQPRQPAPPPAAPAHVTPPRAPLAPPAPMLAPRPAPMPTLAPRPAVTAPPRVDPAPAITPAPMPTLPPVSAAPAAAALAAETHGLPPERQLSAHDGALDDIDNALLADMSASLALDDDGAPEVSLEKEMESLLHTLDTKTGRIS